MDASSHHGADVDLVPVGHVSHNPGRLKEEVGVVVLLDKLDYNGEDALVNYVLDYRLLSLQKEFSE